MDDAWSLEIAEEGPLSLADYASVSIAFEVSEIIEVVESTHVPGRLEISQRRLPVPYVKDYDQLAGEGPLEWSRRFELSNWGLFGARAYGKRVGSAAVAMETVGLDVFEGRRDLAVLWDIRVSPEARGHGVGAELFRSVERWARARSCRTLKVETQNTNAPACRFYARLGCALEKIQRSAYPELPHEIQLLWYKDLLADGVSRSVD